MIKKEYYYTIGFIAGMLVESLTNIVTRFYNSHWILNIEIKLITVIFIYYILKRIDGVQSIKDTSQK